MKNSILILFIILISFTVNSQVTVNAKTDRTSYLIGDYIRYELVVIADSAIVFNWPELNQISNADIITSKPPDTVAIQNKLQIKQEIIYSIYDPGNYVIPGVRITYKKLRDTTFYYVQADSIPLTILSVAVDTTQTIKPIKNIIEVSANDYLWYYILGGILLLAGIITAVYFIFFRKKLKPAVIPILKPVSLYEETIKKLKLLEEKELWQKNELKQYYSELTDILREYMEMRFEMKAFESTSDEIVNELEVLKIPLKQRENISYVLELADLAKFAKSRPDAEDNIKSMQLAFEFTESTKEPQQKQVTE